MMAAEDTLQKFINHIAETYRIKSTMDDDLGVLVTLSHRETGENIQIIILDRDEAGDD